MNLETLLSTNFIQTNSVLYRWRYNKGDYLEFNTNIAPADWYIHLLHAEVGRIGYIDKVMGVYRKHQGGMWASYSDMVSSFKKRQETKLLYLKFWTISIKILEAADFLKLSIIYL